MKIYAKVCCRPLTPETGVRFPLGLLFFNNLIIPPTQDPHFVSALIKLFNHHRQNQKYNIFHLHLSYGLMNIVLPFR